MGAVPNSGAHPRLVSVCEPRFPLPSTDLVLCQPIVFWLFLQAPSFGKTDHENVECDPNPAALGAVRSLVWDLVFRSAAFSEMGYFEQMFDGKLADPARWKDRQS